MSMQDPISDMLTQIRNAQAVKKSQVVLSASKAKLAILKVLQDEGYIMGYEVTNDVAHKKQVTVLLKYYNGRPVISFIKRVSKPGLRAYSPCEQLEKVQGGLGIAIVSTSKGVMSDHEARKLRQGGEVICLVA